MKHNFSATQVAFCGLFGALAITGCSHDTPETPPTSTVVTNSPPPAPSTTTTTVVPGATTTTVANPNVPDTKINTNAGPGTSNGTDSGTADAINAAIVHNKQMTGSRVEAVVTSGVARLNGTVQNQQQKALAGTTASKTPGVTSVINKLTILSTGGAHAVAAKPKTIVKVYNHTTVVHVPTPTGNGGGSSDNTGNGASGNGSNGATSPAGTGDTGGGNAPAAPSTPAPSGSNP